jgi:hypothetical protein
MANDAHYLLDQPYLVTILAIFFREALAYLPLMTAYYILRSKKTLR